MNTTEYEPVIVADIGGTNARFGLATGFDGSSGLVSMDQKRQYLTADFPDFDSVFEHYRDSLGGVYPTRACIAIAGPVKGERVSMTNLNWSVSSSGACHSFGLDRFEIINDYTAQIYATLFLGADELSTICHGEINTHAPRCVVGPGTGLGVAAIAPCNGRWATLSGEGGHITLAGTGEYENRLIRNMVAGHGRISAETALSGPGLLRLYEAVCTIDEYPVLAATPLEITATARSGSDPAASAAVSVFCRLLGGMVGDMILTFGAEGGAFLGGGILPAIESLLKGSDFEQCLKNKGAMSHYLNDINVSLITVSDAALVGAAAWLCHEANHV